MSSLLQRHLNKMELQKNRTLQEMARVMMNSKKLSSTLWAKVINTACYTINRLHLRLGTIETPYEICKSKKY